LQINTAACEPVVVYTGLPLREAGCRTHFTAGHLPGIWRRFDPCQWRSRSQLI